MEVSSRPSPAPVLRRRKVLAGAAAGAAAAWIGGPAALAAAPRRAAANPLVLTLVPNLNFPQWPITPQDFELLRDHALASFTRQNPNVRVELFPDVAVLSGLGGATMAAMLAGDGPDVFADWVAPPFIQNDLVLDIAPFVKRDNVNLQEFLSGQLDYYRASALYSPTNPGGMYMLPGYLNTSAYVVNLTIVDQLGLKQPSPDWTYEDWTRLWRAVTDPGKKRAGGTDLWTGYDFSSGMSPYILRGFGGEYVDPNDTARCYLNTPGSLRAGEWFYGLVNDGVIPTGGFSGTQVTWNATTGDFTAFTQWNGFDWDFFPFPRWPVQPASWGATDFYAIWAGTKHPEAAWQLLKAISVAHDWQYFIARVLLMGPVQRSLWQDWARIIQQAAPPVAGKNLQGAFVEPVVNDQVWVGLVLRYATEQASSIFGKYETAVVDRQISVQGAFAQASTQVDALQAVGPVLADQAATALRSFQSEVARAQASKAPILYAEPPASGVGNLGLPAPQLVKVGAARGTYTLAGAGRGLQGPADGCTFAAGAARQSAGSFICRIVGATAGAAPMPKGAKAGLMVRGSLTDEAALTSLDVTMGGVATPGIHFETRSVAGTNVSDTKPGAAQGAGLLPAAQFLGNQAAPSANYLLKPVWLKLVLDVDHWTAYSSLDGKAWQQAGPPVLVEMAGAWVGLFVTSHHNGQYVHATFDGLQGFAPARFVQIGGA